jgi:hypothetical protein
MEDVMDLYELHRLLKTADPTIAFTCSESPSANCDQVERDGLILDTEDDARKVAAILGIESPRIAPLQQQFKASGVSTSYHGHTVNYCLNETDAEIWAERQVKEQGKDSEWLGNVEAKSLAGGTRTVFKLTLPTERHDMDVMKKKAQAYLAVSLLQDPLPAAKIYKLTHLAGFPLNTFHINQRQGELTIRSKPAACNEEPGLQRLINALHIVKEEGGDKVKQFVIDQEPRTLRFQGTTEIDIALDTNGINAAIDEAAKYVILDLKLPVFNIMAPGEKRSFASRAPARHAAAIG